jgi:carbon starvation protein CstA
MISFLLCILALILGYTLYGKFVDKVFGPDPNRATPAVSKADGVDFIPMPTWKVFMIQFLNIAGTGPIFGAIMGAKFGPSAYLWIVFGCIFAGAVHDYLSGMLSLRHGGAGLPELVGSYLGNGTKKVMLVFTMLMLLLVGAVFVYSPALILGGMAGDGSRGAIMIWVAVIFIYYIIATLLPIDKIIGKIYPLFAFALLFMAVSLMVCLLVKWPHLPELWEGLQNRGPSVGLNGQSIFPCLFITIACGAISGFHATQSPLMARCLKNEKLGRPVFYGSMITEGLVALIWAAVASYFFFDGGAAEVGSDIGAAAPTVVTKVSQSWLGILGGVLALLGVVAAPITSGDTAFRSARLIMADFIGLDQKPIRKRLAIAIPLFV